MRAMFANYSSMQTTGVTTSRMRRRRATRARRCKLATLLRPVHRRAASSAKGVDVRHRAARQRRVFLNTQAQVASLDVVPWTEARSVQPAAARDRVHPGRLGRGGRRRQLHELVCRPGNRPGVRLGRARPGVLCRTPPRVRPTASPRPGAQLRSPARAAVPPPTWRNSVAQVNQMAWAGGPRLNRPTSPRWRGSVAGPNDLLDQREPVGQADGQPAQGVHHPAANDGTMGVFIATAASAWCWAPRPQQLAGDARPGPTRAARGSRSATQRHRARALPRRPCLGGRAAIRRPADVLKNEDLVLGRATSWASDGGVGDRAPYNRGSRATASTWASPSGSGDPIFAVRPAPISDLPNAQQTPRKQARGLLSRAAYHAGPSPTAPQLKASDYTAGVPIPPNAGSFIVTRPLAPTREVLDGARRQRFRVTRALSDKQPRWATASTLVQIAFHGHAWRQRHLRLEPSGAVAAVSMRLQRPWTDPNGTNRRASPDDGGHGPLPTRATATVAGLQAWSSAGADPSIRRRHRLHRRQRRLPHTR